MLKNSLILYQTIYEKLFYPPHSMSLSRFRLFINLIFVYALSLFLTGCFNETESPNINNDKLEKVDNVKVWFEANKHNLRLPKNEAGFRTESQELILPFFEKEPDWENFHHYYFPDGREVFEMNLENATKYFPSTMIDSFPDKNPGDYVIQNIMLVKNPSEERFDPLIIRYFPRNQDNKIDFNSINYNSVNEFWEGKIDIFTYDEHHIVSFELLPDGEKRTIFYNIEPNGLESRIQNDCWQVSRQIVWISPSPGSLEDDPAQLGSTIHTAMVTETFCTGGGSTFPTAGTVYADGEYYYNGSQYDPSGNPCALCYTPPPTPAPSLFIINKLTNPCADVVFKELAKGSSKLTDMTGLSNFDIFPWMLDLFNKGGKFKYVIENIDIPQSPGSQVNGKTKGPNPNSQDLITIQLDNNYVNTATSLSIARTIIHETVHAYIIYLSKTNYTFLQELNNYYSFHQGNYPNAAHGMMSQYLLGMTVSLYNWDKNFGPTGGNLGLDYYYKMSFGGMVQNGTTNPIQEVVPMIPNGNWADIVSTLQKEGLNLPGSKGIKENCN